MKHIVSITLSSSKNNFEKQIRFRGKTVRISQFGADFDVRLMEQLLQRFDGQCDAIAVSGFHPPITIARKTYYHPDAQRFLNSVKHTPVADGFTFRKTYLPWALRKHTSQHGRSLFQQQRVAFLSGLAQQEMVGALAEYTDRLYFADPYFHFKLPVVLKGVGALERYAKTSLPLLRRKTYRQGPTAIDLKHLKESDVFICTATLLERCDLAALKGKTVVLDVLPDSLKYELRSAKVRDVLSFMPDLDGQEGLNYAILEALIQTTKSDDERVNQDDVLNTIEACQLRPTLKSLSKSGVKRPRKFAFVIHPLSVRDLFRHPVLRPLHQAAKPVEHWLEVGLTKMPGMAYGKITGITSPTTGEKTEGIIYTLFDTPRQLIQMDPQIVYEKLVRLTEKAAEEGCDIIGLGGFTKVVGDAGVTVASRSPIPVTTGNSLSAAATLWAARVACQKMGFLPPYEKGKRIRGTAMVVGATGSIGAVSAKLLARVASRVILTGPRGDKLLELKEEILKDAPGSEILVTTNSNKYAGVCDLIVISTSSVDGKVLDLDKVKPGSVICDVSRPLTFNAEQATRRPDVLIIESGELLLPGQVEISCDIGLDESVVYACLAETALLALDGKIENYTLSRHISFKKVSEIYDIAKKHQARLATIRGPVGIITDQEISLCREHALKALSKGGGQCRKLTLVG